MSRFQSSCRAFREQICSKPSDGTAAGLSAEEQALEAHIQSCPQCRAYQQEIAAIAHGLAALNHECKEIPPSPQAAQRWRREILAASQPASSQPDLVRGVLQWWNGLRLARRIALAGFSAAWLLIAVLHLTAPGDSRATLEVAEPLANLRQALETQDRLFAQLRNVEVANRDQSQGSPNRKPAPRSYRHISQKII